MKKLIVIVFLPFCFSTLAFGGGAPYYLNDDSSLELVKGINTVGVVFTIDTTIKEYLKDKFRSDVELKLRLAGIEVKKIKYGDPHLQLKVRSFFNEKNQLYNGYIELSLNKFAIFTEPSISTYSKTWQSNYVFGNTKEDNLRKYVQDVADEFLIYYLKANPKKVVTEQ